MKIRKLLSLLLALTMLLSVAGVGENANSRYGSAPQ